MKKQADPLYRHNLDAERAVLGGLLGDPSKMDVVLEVISAEDFYRQSYRRCFEVMVSLHKAGESIDLVTMSDALQVKGHLAEIGGIQALATLETFQPGLMSHARIVADCAQARKVAEAAQALAEATKTETPIDLHEQAIKLVQLSEPRRVRRSDVAATELMQAFADMSQPGKVETKPPIPTPFPALTAILHGGWAGGNRPYMFGARRKGGKTTFALQVAVDAATRHNVPTVLFNLELDMHEVLCRMVSAHAEIPYLNVKNRSFSSAAEQQRFVETLELCYTDKLRIDASRWDKTGVRPERIHGSRTIEGMRRTLQRIKTEQEIGLIVVDHLHRIQPAHPCSIFEHVTQASNGLAALAQEFGIPLVAMLQLNDAKGGEPPTAMDTRGGQEIGNDCHALILLDRPPIRKPDEEQARMSKEEKEEATLVVALHGSGATGTIPMRYEGAHMRWYQANEPSFHRRETRA